MATPTATVVDINSLLDSRVGYRDGRPFIRGARLSVDTIAAAHLQGMTVDEMHEQHPHVSVASIFAALAFFYQHKAEIEAQWDRDAEDAEEEARRLGIEVL